MDRRKKSYLMSRMMLVLICCLTLLLGTTGCLQDYVPRLFQERELDEEQLAGEADALQEKTEPKELPAGVLSFKVYYVEGKNRYLVPVTVLKPWTEGIARASLEQLIKGPTPAEEMRFSLSSPLPPKTEILGINIRAGLCRVDFSPDFLEYDPGTERQVLGSIIHTLLQFDTVNEVEIVVEGATVETFPGGASGRGTFDRSYSLNLEVAEGVERRTDDLQQYRLFFCTLLGEDRIFYVPVTRVLAGEEEDVEIAMQELLKGPRRGSGLFSDLPEETILKNYNLRGGVLEVNLSQELMDYQGGLSGEENILNQLLLTLTDLPGVERVQILVEGEETVLQHGTSLKGPLAPPMLLNQLDYNQLD